MAQEGGDDLQFNTEETQKSVQDTIERCLGGKQYNEQMVPHWINEICEEVIANLTKESKPYKYICHVLIMQRTGVGACSSNSCYWDGVMDNVAAVKWPKDKESKGEQARNQMNCIVTVFAASLVPNN